MDDEKVPLTDKQQQVYDFIREEIHLRGYGPSVREIGERFSIKSPNGVMCHLHALVRKGLITRVPDKSRAISLVDREGPTTVIPLSGMIAAGSPVQQFEQPDTIDLGTMFCKKGQYALQVRGQSMIEDHIDDGDYVIIRHTETAKDGEVVVALVDGEETTLKRFYREKGRYRLEPANHAMDPIYSTNVQVLGVLVGVVRRFDNRR